ncbi:TPA: phosphatidylserine decarboxylase [Campylobacter lari]|uniref:phosphatidylserine decarboxylase n=1 Tax=Campylobacter sp. IFREMER_LSEM_CL908 TaxID=2911624 RepID=UPI0017F3C20B|nr:phosphatidylserine decarboxylase [Campylobacter sp. IFREMER_LSEM_CL908]EAJ0348821.1 phosphatidylserine decarboxylase [Campylobacter lari]EFO9213923.1 phosphatidylserine decarboxylase [Campylobacter lari]EGK8030277.1 phosphatidylserine decarboxylase [Campylobacter lari]EGK8036744.1 phosphatidylserine decarboxylase [Campylobacter lari]ELF2320034.1 phosphatidylserine decarboxylase [Campylobacter lari]
MKTNFIAKTGWSLLIVLAIVFAIFQFIWGFSWLLWCIFIFFIYLFRAKKIDYIADPNTIIAPIEGKIKCIKTSSYKELGECIEVQIINNIFSQGNIIAPLDMNIEETRIRHGLFLCPFMKNTNLMGERMLFLANSKSKQWALRVIFGALNRKAHIDDFGHHLSHGQNIGFMFDGSVSLLLPKDTRICVNENDKVRIGTLIGYLNP